MPRFHFRLFALFTCIAALSCGKAAWAEGNDDAELARARADAMKAYKGQVTPFMTVYCAACHSGKKQKGGVTFQGALKNPEASSSRLLWKRASVQIKSHDMPPDDADKQPSDAERKAIIDWIAGIKSPINMPMIAITTSNSTSVNARRQNLPSP